tara:strand:- start:1568 stop:2548 length:981 start_codon:yes stop_codon:yes gene_type:complete
LYNILITGGAGYIGRQIINLIDKKKFNIVVVDNLNTTKKNYLPKNIKVEKINILNKKKLEKLFSIYNFDGVIHLAAKCVVSESQKYPDIYYETNIIGTKNIIRYSKKFKVKHFIFSSSCSIYGNSDGIVKENNKKKPVSYYGKTKLIGENLIKRSFKNTKIKFVILRYFNVVGADLKNKIGEIGDKDRLFNNISKKIINKNFKINIYGNDYKTKDGTCIRDYMHVYDLATIHLICLKKFKHIKKSLELNCSYGKGYSVLDIVKSFEKIAKRKINLIYKERRNGDTEKVIASNKKLNQFIKWKPKFNKLDSMVSTTFLWNKYLNKNL